MSRSAPMFVAILFVSALTRVAVAADEAKTIATHDRWVTSVAHSSDGAIIATAGGQSLQYRPGDVLLWDAKSGNLIAALEGHTS
ncbi:MAG: hypothetical protein KDB05_31540, partial [Planctomycetales bacterium]|nr:hypothetical protein [Planctomycetales bacterium]